MVKATLEALPWSTSVLCFDTLFHTSIAPHKTTYPVGAISHPIPVPLRRYGFHGLSYCSILRQMAAKLGKDEQQVSLVVVHAGSGASACLIIDGKSIDTSMGLTPLEGSSVLQRTLPDTDMVQDCLAALEQDRSTPPSSSTTRLTARSSLIFPTAVALLAESSSSTRSRASRRSRARATLARSLSEPLVPNPTTAARSETRRGSATTSL